MTLFDRTTDFNNLYAAYKVAASGKHDRAEILRHDLHAEKILWRLRAQLLDGSYRHGTYRTFQVYDPKVRDVSAAPFTDRIVHHALVRQIEPLFERIFIYDSYACRKAKGTHAAVLRLQHFLRAAHARYGEFYVLRADIRKFFASIDHTILLNLLAKQITDFRTLELCHTIVSSYREPTAFDRQQLALALDSSLSLSLSLGKPLKTNGLVEVDERLASKTYAGSMRGMPIGNLTSQLFANIYLNHLDQFVKHQLRERYYLRYMDDVLILHPTQQHLRQVQTALSVFAIDELALTLHPAKTQVHRFDTYERFVGYDAGLFVRRLSKPTVQRFVRRLDRIQRQQGRAKAQESWQQFKAYSSFAHARGLLAAIDPFNTGSVQDDETL